MDVCPFLEAMMLCTAPQLMNLSPTSTTPSTIQHGSSPAATKLKLYNKYNTAEGCKFDDKCHFAHSVWELGKPIVPSHEEPRTLGPIASCIGGHQEPPALPGIANSFGAPGAAKINVDVYLAGVIFGKGGVNSKQICRLRGTKLAILDHESDAKLRNIKLKGTFEQIQELRKLVLW